MCCCLVAQGYHLVHWRGLQRPGGFNCVLKPGLELKSFLTFNLRLSDFDECQSGEGPCGPNSRCHNTNGSFYCTCQRDYIPTSGTRHFHPAGDVRCKGQCEDSKEHVLAFTHFLFIASFLNFFFSLGTFFGGESITQYCGSRCNLEFCHVLSENHDVTPLQPRRSQCRSLSPAGIMEIKRAIRKFVLIALFRESAEILPRKHRVHHGDNQQNT